MKKLLALNIGVKGFRNEFDEAVKTYRIDADVIRARYCCFILEGNKASLFHKGKEIIPEQYGYVFIRVTGRFAHMTSLIAQYFNAHHVPISDNDYMQHTHNEEKITQMLRFTLANIPIPPTILFSREGFAENAETILGAISYPCVLKTNGSKGRNVWKIADQTALEEKIAELNAEVVMIQKYIPNTSDIRAIYMHGEVIGAIERSSTDGFHNNVSAGGTAKVIDLTSEEIALTKQACTLLGRSFAGADIVRTQSGPMLFEVNLGPQIYGFEGATGIDVPAKLVERIKRDFLEKEGKPNLK